MSADKQINELRESGQKYRKLFEISPVAIFLEDLKGNVVFSNERARRLYGFSKKETEGLGLKNIVPPELVKNYRLLIKNLRKKGSLTFESRARRKNGDIFPCSLSVGLVKLGGEEYVQAVVSDITERR